MWVRKVCTYFHGFFLSFEKSSQLLSSLHQPSPLLLHLPFRVVCIHAIHNGVTRAQICSGVVKLNYRMKLMIFRGTEKEILRWDLCFIHCSSRQKWWIKQSEWAHVPVLKRLVWCPCFLFEWLHFWAMKVSGVLCPLLFHIILMGSPLHNQPLRLGPTLPGHVVRLQCGQSHHSNTIKPPTSRVHKQQQMTAGPHMHSGKD